MMRPGQVQRGQRLGGRYPVRRTRMSVVVMAVSGLALMAAAWGGDDSRDAASTTAGGGAPSSTAPTTTAAGTTPTTVGAQPASLAEWEALWSKERAAIVKRIKDNKWGRSADGKTLTGPEGWTVDLSKCPTDWSDTEGVSDTTIKIGAT